MMALSSLQMVEEQEKVDKHFDSGSLHNSELPKKLSAVKWPWRYGIGPLKLLLATLNSDFLKFSKSKFGIFPLK